MEIVDLMSGMEDRGWQARSNCMGVDPDLFFPERGASTREAKEVCRGCVVRNDCLEYALDNGASESAVDSDAHAPSSGARRLVDSAGPGLDGDVGTKGQLRPPALILFFQ